MNEQLDLIINRLPVDQHWSGRLNVISEACEQAGYGSAEPYLQHLLHEGYIEESEESAFMLSRKGDRVRRAGGFALKAIIARESRIALVFSILVALFLCAAIVALLGVDKI
jgi:hypothetical protein